MGLPVTIYRPTNGVDELGQSDGADITTLAGVGITTLAGVQLTIADGSVTEFPATTWAEDDGA